MFAVLVFLAVLSVLVLVHELGHFVAARICGVKAEEFGYGFPPRAVGYVRLNGKWKRVRGGDRNKYPATIWSLNWLPLGGFVRLKGEQGEDGRDPDSFLSKNAFQRTVILSAGVLMNWLLAASIFFAGFVIGVPAQTDGLPPNAIVREEKIQIGEILKGSAAEKAGLLVGDFLLAVDGTSLTHVTAAQALLLEKSAVSGTLALTIERAHATQTVDATPLYIEELNRPGLGVALMNTGIVRFTPGQAAIQAVGVTYTYTKLILGALWGVLRDLFVERRVSADVAGPVGIAVLTGQVAEQGIWTLLQFAALLSINLAVVNFLPIPALDGGRALFVLVESLRRKRTNPRFEAALHQIGFVILLILVALVTVRDLRQYGGMILRGLGSLIGF